MDTNKVDEFQKTWDDDLKPFLKQTDASKFAKAIHRCDFRIPRPRILKT